MSYRTSPFLSFLFVSTVMGLHAQQTVIGGHCPGTDNTAGPCTIRHAGVDGSGRSTEAGAQTSGVIGFGGGLQDRVEIVKGLPYSATALTELKQTLANGAHISHTTQATVARDSGGRTYRSQRFDSIGPMLTSDELLRNVPTLTTVFDPVAHRHVEFTDTERVAHVLPLPADGRALFLSTRGGAQMAPGSDPSMTGPVRVTTGGVIDAGRDQPQPVVEELGERQISGLVAVGSRIVTTIPVNAMGNDQPLRVSNEFWYSKDLKVILLSIQDDPRFGTTTYSLADIKREEPPKDWFQIPAGYKIDSAPEPPAIN